jgi:GNAT superfamily N-acetyltransferase
MAEVTAADGEIRIAHAADIPAMHAIRLRVRENVLSDPSKVRPSDYEPYLTSRGRGWVHVLDGEVTGFAIADAETRSIWALFVDPAHEGRGIGRRLHDVLLAWLFRAETAPVWLTTEPGTRAARMYEASGWRLVGSAASGEARFERSCATRFGFSAADRALQTDFECGRLPTAEFTHRAHVVIAYVYLAQSGVDDATANMRAGLIGYLKHHGIDPAKFHETLTAAWILAVSHFMQRGDPCTCADDFISRNPDLLDAGIMLTHYSAARLLSEEARRAYIEPDLQLIPRSPA